MEAMYYIYRADKLEIVRFKVDTEDKWIYRPCYAIARWEACLQSQQLLVSWEAQYFDMQEILCRWDSKESKRGKYSKAAYSEESDYFLAALLKFP